MVNGGKYWLDFGIDVGKTHYHVMQDKMCEVATLSYYSACCISLIDQVCFCSKVHPNVKWTMYSCWKQSIVTYLSLHYFEYFKLREEIVDNWVAFISHGSLFVKQQLLSQLTLLYMKSGFC